MNFGGGGASTLSGRLLGGGASCERIQKDCYTLSHRGDILLSPCIAKHLLEGLQAAVEHDDGLETARRLSVLQADICSLWTLLKHLTSVPGLVSHP